MVKIEDLDEIDKEIIHLLFQDGKLGLKDIGDKMIDLHGSTLSHVAIRNRINKMANNVFKIQANLNMNSSGFFSVYVLIETKDYDTQRKLIEKGQICPRVVSLETISGKYNILLKIVASKLQDIDCFMTSVIKSDDMIRNFEMIHCQNQIKPKFIPIQIPSHNANCNLHTPCGQNCAFCGMYKDGVCQGCPGSKYSLVKYADLVSEKE